MRLARRLGVLLVVTGLALAAGAGPALAHNVLVDSSPKKNSEIESSPTELKLVFDQQVQDADLVNTVTLTGPGDTRWATDLPKIENNTVRVPVLGPLGPAGEYTIAFRILSADGHPVGDRFSFRLTKDGPGTPVQTGLPSSAPTTGADKPQSTLTSIVVKQVDPDEGTPVWLWFVAAAVLLGVGMVIALRFSRAPSSRD